MRHRLGLGVRQSREWCTVSLLAQALHIGRDEVRKWVDRGWLHCRVVQAQSVRLQIIDAEDFCSFVKNYGREVIGNRLSYEGLAFFRDTCFTARMPIRSRCEVRITKHRRCRRLSRHL